MWASLRLGFGEARVATNEDFYQVFGHISLFFTTWDFLLSQILVSIIDPSKTKIHITERMTLGQKLQVVDDLRPEHVSTPIILEELKQLLPEEKPVAEKRNRFIHDLWLFAPEAVGRGQISRLKISFREKGAFVVDQQQTTLDELYKFLEKVGTMQQLCQDVIARHQEELGIRLSAPSD